MTNGKFKNIPPSAILAFEFAKVFFFVFCFLVSIDLMGGAFKASGKGFAETLMRATSNPFIGLIIGIVVTSLIQSSSSTTSIIVAMVAAGTLTLEGAIPMVMGANIGTTVTNTIVSFGYVGRKIEFERAFSASIVHDMFNIYATIILFPIEIYTGIIFKTATYAVSLFAGMGGLKLINPLKIIIKPVSGLISGLIDNHIVMIVVAMALLFYSMSKIVDNMKGLVMEKIEKVLNNYLFRNNFISFIFGIFFTVLVQSSSITTSIVIPLVGAGLLTIDQIFTFTLGANIGTTITAFLASLTFGVESAVAVAFAHLTFNIFGIAIIYPIKQLPLWSAKRIGHFAAKSKKHFLIFIVIYILLHFIPILFAFFT